MQFDDKLHEACPKGFNAKYHDGTQGSPPIKSTTFTPQMSFVEMYGLHGHITNVYLTTYYQKPPTPKRWTFVSSKKQKLTIARQEIPHIGLSFNTELVGMSMEPGDSDFTGFGQHHDPAKAAVAAKVYEALKDHFIKMGYTSANVLNVTGLDIPLNRTDKPLMAQIEEVHSELQKIYQQCDIGKSPLGDIEHAAPKFVEAPAYRPNRSDPYADIIAIGNHMEATQKRRAVEDAEKIMETVKEHMPEGKKVEPGTHDKFKDALIAQLVLAAQAKNQR